MDHVVFYRNLNLGQPKSPTRTQLVEALLQAGARAARSFQTNGTVLLDADDPGTVVAAAAPILHEVAGYDGVGLVRSLEVVERAIGSIDFDEHTDERTDRATVTVFDAGPAFVSLPWDLPWTNERDDLDLITVVDGIALGVVRRHSRGIGNPTGLLEKVTGGAATTRTLGTIQRLLRTVARDQSAGTTDPSTERKLS